MTDLWDPQYLILLASSYSASSSTWAKKNKFNIAELLVRHIFLHSMLIFLLLSWDEIAWLRRRWKFSFNKSFGLGEKKLKHVESGTRRSKTEIIQLNLMDDAQLEILFFLYVAINQIPICSLIVVVFILTYILRWDEREIVMRYNLSYFTMIDKQFLMNYELKQRNFLN